MFPQDIDALEEAELIKIVEDVDKSMLEYAEALDREYKTTYIQYELSLSAKQSRYLDRFGELNFLFLLVDRDIVARIDKKSSEYEIQLYKRIKGEG